MNSDNKNGFKVQVLQLVDALVVLVAFWLGVFVWQNFGVGLAEHLDWIRVDGAHIESLSAIMPILFCTVPFIPLSLELMGFYRRHGKQNLAKAFVRIIKAHFLVAVIFSLLMLLLKFTPHRPSMVFGFVISAALIWVREYCLLRRNLSNQLKGKGKIRILIAGYPKVANEWWDSIADSEKLRYELMGIYQFDDDDLDILRDQLSKTSVELVLFLANDLEFDVVTRAMEECEIQGVEVWLAANFVRARICQPKFDVLGETPMLVLRSTPSLSWALLAKDMVDRIGSFFLICGTFPFWIFAYVGIKIQSAGPVMYKQERAGKYGKPFQMYKFRSMVMDADKKLDDLKKEAGNQMSGPVFKLDELPQLINVLRGEMSLVGPRPMAMYELPDIHKSEHRRKFSVKPGLTCIWQVEGRNSITDFDEWVQLDLKYIDNWSFWLDLKLLLKTVPAVLFSKGAK